MCEGEGEGEGKGEDRGKCELVNDPLRTTSDSCMHAFC